AYIDPQTNPSPVDYAVYNSLTPGTAIYLDAGSHVIVVDYKNGVTDVEARLYWMGPGNSSFTIIPPSVFSAPQGGDPVPNLPYLDCQSSASICGNGIVEPGEECDDGNTEESDGCTSACIVVAIDPPGPGPVCSGGQNTLAPQSTYTIHPACTTTNCSDMVLV